MTRPALILRDGGDVHARRLREAEGGVLAIDPAIPYSHMGSVGQSKVVIDGLTRKRWFAQTPTDIQLGPFANRVKAIAALLAYHNLHQATVDETSSPLF